MKLYSALYPVFNPFSHFYPDFERVEVNSKSVLEPPGILIIHGGSDIHPSLYGRPNVKSFVGNAPSARDMAEMKLMAQAIDKGIFIMGICRGAQLACAMAGGILVQHVDGHSSGGHRITTTTGDKFMVTSAHHQMMYPWNVTHDLLAWSSVPRGTDYLGLEESEMAVWPTTMFEEGKEPGLLEPEVIWFSTIKCLAVQGHPEWMDNECAFNIYLKRLINDYCPTA